MKDVEKNKKVSSEDEGPERRDESPGASELEISSDK